MSKFKGRLRHLERETEGARWDLVCPECGWEIVVYGDAPIDLIVIEWSQGVDSETHGPPPHPSLVKLAEHEHDPFNFVERTSGLPWMSREVSGLNLGGVAHDA